ncbi:MAG TPA: MarR family transcriptional regulator [Bordetella sp.]|uniref:MarR family winged helix-turn-helix transcriptional regulator n=1 Tax=Bordetella sp. TaxID=28081 RepID=UPI002ED3B214
MTAARTSAPNAPPLIYGRPGFLLRRAHQLSVGLFERQCAEFGLTPPQYGVLSVLSYAPDIDQITLAKALGYDKVTISHVVRGLQARSLLTRETTSAGRRRMIIRLTRQGRTLLRKAAVGAARAHDELLRPLPPEEQGHLLRLLDQLCSALEDQARAPMVKLLP